MKNGVVFVAPASVAAAICGFGPIFGYAFAFGLLPPGPGCAWQLTQLLELKAGPSPPPFSPASVPLTESTCMNRDNPSLKYSVSSAVSVESAIPAPILPARTPGSFAVVATPKF